MEAIIVLLLIVVAVLAGQNRRAAAHILVLRHEAVQLNIAVDELRRNLDNIAELTTHGGEV